VAAEDDLLRRLVGPLLGGDDGLQRALVGLDLDGVAQRLRLGRDGLGRLELDRACR
jgi:hypothetical protein